MLFSLLFTYAGICLFDHLFRQRIDWKENIFWAVVGSILSTLLMMLFR
jgi:hypothetical protein